MPYLLVSPCVAIAITTMSFMLIGDGLRDALDPRTTGRRRAALPDAPERASQLEELPRAA
jgi:hypothetical protein